MRARATLLENRAARNILPLPSVRNPIKLGVVGLGPRSAGNVIRKSLLYEDFNLVSVCDIRPELVDKAVTEVQQSHNIKIKGYTDFDKMLANEQLDAVAVQIDADKQIALACQAMEAGCHVMVEVPLAYSIEDCWKAVVTTERTGKIFLLMEQLRYSGYIRAWHEIVKSGIIGKPLLAEGEYFASKSEMYFQDNRGRFYDPNQAKTVPDVMPTWRNRVPNIGYLPHELSPLLYVLDDRVKRVVGMSTKKPSYKYSNLNHADMQVALMHTEKDVLMKMAVGHGTAAIKRGEMSGHWHHIKGTEGVLEWQRSDSEKPKLWVENWQLNQPIEMPWGVARTDAPPEAINSGHGDCDYYVFAQFADAVLRGVALEFDIYKAADTAAPAILAAVSMDQDNMPQEVPDFRPGPNRKHGQLPTNMKL
jgi:predicted dehydrogenase